MAHDLSALLVPRPGDARSQPGGAAQHQHPSHVVSQPETDRSMCVGSLRAYRAESGSDGVPRRLPAQGRRHVGREGLDDPQVERNPELARDREHQGVGRLHGGIRH